jgi:hypothetical protein
MKIAVVILNWNGAALLRQFLPTIIKFSGEADVYVADNASTDDSVAIIRNDFPTVKIILNDKNYGFAEGYNRALKSVDADIYALVNSDVEVTEHWLKPIFQQFRSEPLTAIIQPKILDFKRKEFFEYAGAAGGFIDKYGYPFCRGRIFEHLEQDNGQYNDNIDIFWASGACMFIRKQVYDELDGFDAYFFAHQEEIDLCWRAFNLGYKARFVSASTIYHVGGATLDSAKPQKTYLNFRNSLLMLLKNLPQNQLYKVLFVRMLLDGVAGIRFVIHGKPAHCWAVIRAHGAFYAMFRNNYQKRMKSPGPNYYKIGSIVYASFIKGCNSYKNLF